MSAPSHSMAGSYSDLSSERFAALPLLEQDRIIRQRADQGNPIEVPVVDAAVREAIASGAVGGYDDTAVRESASVSDLPGLMANTLYRRIDDWFQQYQGAFMQYAHQEEAADYKVHTVIFPSELEDAVEIRQERDYIDSGLQDKVYTMQLRKWGRSISLPFQVIENDDKGFLRQMPGRMARASERTIAKIAVRNTLEANPNAYDGVAIYSASRGSATFGGLTGNLISGGGSAFSSANVQAGIAAVNSFTGDADLNPSGVPLNIPARFLVVPPSLSLQAAQLINSTILIAAGTASPIQTAPNLNPLGSQVIRELNPVLEVVTERYLTNTTAWYLLPEKDAGPLCLVTRQGRGLRPRLMRNIPMRQSVGGGGADDYLLLADDQVYVWSFDMAAVASSCVRPLPVTALQNDGEIGEPCNVTWAAAA